MTAATATSTLIPSQSPTTARDTACSGRSEPQRHQRRETRQQRNQKARWSARSAPKHIQPRGGTDERRDGREQGQSQKSRVRATQNQPGTGYRGKINRAVEQQPEFLIKKESEQTVRDVRREDVDPRVVAVGCFRIERTVDRVERVEPERRDHSDWKSRMQGARAAGARDARRAPRRRRPRTR